MRNEKERKKWKNEASAQKTGHSARETFFFHSHNSLCCWFPFSCSTSLLLMLLLLFFILLLLVVLLINETTYKTVELSVAQELFFNNIKIKKDANGESHHNIHPIYIFTFSLSNFCASNFILFYISSMWWIKKSSWVERLYSTRTQSWTTTIYVFLIFFVESH